MTVIPDFSKVDFAASAATAQSEGPVWETPEGIPVKPVYGAEDREDLGFVDGWPGAAKRFRQSCSLLRIDRITGTDHREFAAAGLECSNGVIGVAETIVLRRLNPAGFKQVRRPG